MSIAQRYAARIRSETGYFAAWLPNSVVRLGDFGSLDGSVFQPLGNMGQVPEIRESPSTDISIVVGVTHRLSPEAGIDADTGVATGTALIDIDFNDEVGIVLNASDARLTRIVDLVALGNRLRSIQPSDDWKADSWFVHEVTTVGRATIFASQGRGAKIRLKVSANASGLAEALASVSGASSAVMERHIGVKIFGHGPLTPLFRLARLKRRLFGDRVISFRGGDEMPMEPLERYDLEDGDILETY
jgi:hypothetical protein